MLNDVVVTNFVQRLRGDAGNNMRCDHIKDVGGELSRTAHGLEVFLGMYGYQ